MADESRNDTDERFAVIVHTELAEELRLAFDLSRELIGRVAPRNARVMCRVVELGVDTVHNALKLVLLGDENAVESVGVPRVEYLPCIAWGNGDELI